MTAITRDDTVHGVEYVTKHEAQEEITAAKEHSLRWVLDKIRTRQREIRDIQDRFSDAKALHDAEIMRIRYNELDALAEEINRRRFALNNPNA